MGNAARDEIARLWLKADETSAGDLVRCVDLAVIVMARDSCGLDDAAARVCETMGNADPAPEFFMLREGYAKPTLPPIDPRSPCDSWRDGQPVPDGYRVEVVGVDRHAGLGSSSRWYAEGMAVRRVSRLVWAGTTPEPQRALTVREWMDQLAAQWRLRARAGNLDGAGSSARLEWSSRLAIRRMDADRLGMSRPSFKVAALAPPKSTPDPIDVSELRARIAAHRPMVRQGSRWKDLNAMILELKRQYDERMQLPNANHKQALKNIGALWGLEDNTIKGYVRDANALSARSAVNSSRLA